MSISFNEKRYFIGKTSIQDKNHILKTYCSLQNILQLIPEK